MFYHINYSAYNSKKTLFKYKTAYGAKNGVRTHILFTFCYLCTIDSIHGLKPDL